jgi:hypothetical protein
MSTGGNVSATYNVQDISGTTIKGLDIFALGPPNPGWDPTPSNPHGFEQNQTSLWWTQGESLSWAQWIAANHYPIDPEWAVNLAAAPCLISSGGYALDVFVASEDGTLWHLSRSNNGTWGGWEFLAVPGYPPNLTTVSSTPAAISRGGGLLDVFVWGADGNLWQRSFDKKWDKWENRGAPTTTVPELASAPAVVSWGSKRVDVFALGADGNVWQQTWDGQWHGWQPHTAPASVSFAGAPAAAAIAPNQLAVIMRAKDGSLWCKTYLPPIPAQTSNTGPPAHPGSSHWSSGFVRIVSGDTVASAPAALTGGPNVIDVFAVNYANNLIHVHLDWVSAPSIPSGPPFVTYYDPDCGVAVIATAYVLAVAPPCPVSWGGKRLDVFAVDPTGTVHHFWWTGSPAWSAEAMPGVVVPQP